MLVQDLIERLAAKGFDGELIKRVIKEEAINQYHADFILFTPIEVNDKLSSTAGKAHMHRNGKPKKIELASLLFQNGPKPLWDIFIHEIAHLLTPGCGHDWRWRMVARKMGNDGNRCHDYTFMPGKRRSKKLVGYCEYCGDEIWAKTYCQHGREYTHRGCGGNIVAIHRDEKGAIVVDKTRNAKIEALLRKKASSDPRVIAIRADKLIGMDTDSVVNTFSNLQLVQELDKQKIVKPVFARMYYRKIHRTI